MSLNNESAHFYGKHINEASHVLEGLQKRYPQWNIDGIAAWAESWDVNDVLDTTFFGKVKFYVGWWLIVGETSAVLTPEAVSVSPVAGSNILTWYGVGIPQAVAAGGAINFYGFMVDGFSPETSSGVLMTVSFDYYSMAGWPVALTYTPFAGTEILEAIAGCTLSAADAVQMNAYASRVGFRLPGFQSGALPFDSSWSPVAVSNRVTWSLVTAAYDGVTGLWRVVGDLVLKNKTTPTETLRARVVGGLRQVRTSFGGLGGICTNPPVNRYRWPTVLTTQQYLVGDYVFTDIYCTTPIQATATFLVDTAKDQLRANSTRGLITTDLGTNCP